MWGFSEASTATPIREVEKWWRPLSFEELVVFLKRGWPLPKDAFIDTDVAGLHSNSYSHRGKKFERAVLHALTGPGASADQNALALQIANCARKNRCKRNFCYICNQRYWSNRRALAEQLFANCEHDTVSWCTVIIGFSQNGWPILKPMISDFKVAFAQALERFEDVTWSGRIEIDYLNTAVSALKPKKAMTLSAMNWDPSCELATLVPHAHLIVGHSTRSREVLSYHLKRVFPEYRRLQLRAFRTTRDHSDSLDHLVRYPIKPPLDAPYLAGRRSKNYIPRDPAVLRYIIRMTEALDSPNRRQRLEFDRFE